MALNLEPLLEVGQTRVKPTITYLYLYNNHKLI